MMENKSFYNIRGSNSAPKLDANSNWDEVFVNKTSIMLNQVDANKLFDSFFTFILISPGVGGCRMIRPHFRRLVRKTRPLSPQTQAPPWQWKDPLASPPWWTPVGATCNKWQLFFWLKK